MIFSNKTRTCLQKVTLRVPYDIKDHFGVLKCTNRFNVKKKYEWKSFVKFLKETRF